MLCSTMAMYLVIVASGSSRGASVDVLVLGHGRYSLASYAFSRLHLLLWSLSLRQSGDLYSDSGRYVNFLSFRCGRSFSYYLVD